MVEFGPAESSSQPTPSRSAAESPRNAKAWGRVDGRSMRRSPPPAPAACAGRAWDGRPSGGGRAVFFVQLLLTRPIFRLARNQPTLGVRLAPALTPQRPEKEAKDG